VRGSLFSDTGKHLLIAKQLQRGHSPTGLCFPDLFCCIGIYKFRYDKSFKEFFESSPVREVVKGCPVPVVIAGGPKMNTDRDVLEMVKGAVEAGGAGTSIGRNIFQHKNPTKMVRAIAKIVHEGYDVDEAMKELK